MALERETTKGEHGENEGRVSEVPDFEIPARRVHLEAPMDVEEGARAEEEEESQPESPQRAGSEGQQGSEAVESFNSDLPEFDWQDLSTRYMVALQEANNEEDAILEEFHRFSDAFDIWAQATANHDNERALKRLKTRERFVQLSEHALEEKRNHYQQVIQAFKSAFDLL